MHVVAVLVAAAMLDDSPLILLPLLCIELQNLSVDSSCFGRSSVASPPIGKFRVNIAEILRIF